MADEGTGGSRTADDERRLDELKQQIEGMDEALCNLTQMLTALIVKYRLEPIQTQPNWKETQQKGEDLDYSEEEGTKLDARNHRVAIDGDLHPVFHPHDEPGLGRRH